MWFAYDPIKDGTLCEYGYVLRICLYAIAIAARLYHAHMEA